VEGFDLLVYSGNKALVKPAVVVWHRNLRRMSFAIKISSNWKEHPTNRTPMSNSMNETTY
jgi:hypothetical protein